MSKQVYISADYDQNNGDQAVVEELTKWGSDNLHKVGVVPCKCSRKIPKNLLN